jgi:hypothetical protein
VEDVLRDGKIATTKPRRGSNPQSSGNNGAVVAGLKSKFEVNDIDEEAVEGI